MGNFAISLKVKILAWASAILIVGLNAKLVYDQIGDWLKDSQQSSIYIYIFVVPIVVGICLLLLYVFLRPMFYKHSDMPVYIPHGIANAITELDAVTYKHLAITIDFSKNDKDCMRHAIMQGGKHATYTLIHVVETAGARYYGGQVMDNETQSDADNLDKYVEAMKKLGYKAEGEIGYGTPASAIADIVNKNGIDFIVMGSHGHKALKDIIFGTTVNSVRHMVNVPVLIVKPQRG